MINLFSLEILIGLTVGIFIGWVLKKSLMKNEKSIDEVDLANTVKNLEQTIKDYQKENSEERGSIKKIIEDSRTGIADVIKAADNIKNKTECIGFLALTTINEQITEKPEKK